MSQVLILQLERFGPLSAEEKLAIVGTDRSTQAFAPGVELALEDGRAQLRNVLLAGVACRYIVLAGGRRQILAYVLPGEFCDRWKADACFSDHRIGTLSEVSVGSYSRKELMYLRREFPRVGRALALAGAVEQATLYQWLLNLGHRSALERTAHQLCELATRLRVLGLARSGVCAVPLKQTDLADALALSPAHISRTLTEIRGRKLARFGRHQLAIDDLPGLQSLAGFQPYYLFGTRLTQPQHERCGT